MRRPAWRFHFHSICSMQEQPGKQELDESIKDLAERCAGIYEKSTGEKFSFDQEGLQLLNKELVNDYSRKDPPTGKTLFGIQAIIGEVIIRQVGGQWVKPEASEEHDGVVVERLNGERIDPNAWIVTSLVLDDETKLVELLSKEKEKSREE